jgi:signal transduction histidine kinase
MARNSQIDSTYRGQKHGLLRRVNLIRFLLPLALFSIVVVFETQEHWLETGKFEFQLISEIVFFGILGPLAVFLTLTYIMSLMQQLIAAREETETTNRSLEKTVAERTAALAERNDELAAANKELQQLDQMKSDFVSLVSHELKAPLTTLNGGLEMVLLSGELPEKTRRILGVMAGETQRLTHFVQTILDVSQLEAGKLVLNPGPIAVRPLLERAAETVLPDNGRALHWHIERDLPPLWADEIYFEEIVRNLLTNANKYTPVTAPIDIAARMDDHCLKVSITDYGPGIPANQQAQLFDQFYRQERGDKVSTRGWGLGLHFAKALTEVQGGCLTLTSPAHSDPAAPGTRFTITLPLTEEVPEDGEVALD